MLNSKNNDRLIDILFLLTSVVLLFVFLGRDSIYGPEARCAIIAREMLLNSDFFHPTIAGMGYFDKPLLTYWIIAFFSAISGVVNEWTVRIPSAIAGLVTLFATIMLGKKLWSAQVGKLAGWIALSTYGLLFWSRVGTAEAENLVAIILAVTWYFLKRDNLNFKFFLVFYLITFVGALTKGLTAIVIPVLIVGIDMIDNKKWKELFKTPHFIALAIGIIVYLSSFAYSSMTAPATYDENGIVDVFKENVLRYTNPYDHKQPVYYYLYYLPFLILPWAPMFFAAFSGMLTRWKTLDKNSKWLIKSIAVIFLFFTFCGSRRGHYMLCMIPLCSLLISIFWIYLKDNKIDIFKRIGNIAQAAFFGFILLLEFLAPVILYFLNFKCSTTFIIVTESAAIIMLVLGIYFYFSKPRKTILAFVLMALIITGTFFLYQSILLDTYASMRSLAFNIKTEMPNIEPERIAFYRSENTNVDFYLDTKRPVRVLENEKDLEKFLENKEPLVLIVKKNYLSGELAGFSGKLNSCKKIEEQLDPWRARSEREQNKKLVVFFVDEAI